MFDGLAIRLDGRHQLFNVSRRCIRRLESCLTDRTGATDKRITGAQQLFRAAVVENNHRFPHAVAGQRDLARHVGTDKTGYHCGAWGLRRNYEMDSRRSAELCDADDIVFDRFLADQHEVCQLVNDADYAVHTRLSGGFHAHRGHLLISCVHLICKALKRLYGVLRALDDRTTQVRDARPCVELDPFWVDQHQLAGLWFILIDKTGDNGIE